MKFVPNVTFSQIRTGIFKTRPDLPKYTVTYYVHVVVSYINTLSSNPMLSLDLLTKKHCVKGVRIRSFCSPYFPAFGLNTDQKNSKYGHFSRSEISNITILLHTNYICFSINKYICFMPKILKHTKA